MLNGNDKAKTKEQQVNKKKKTWRNKLQKPH